MNSQNVLYHKVSDDENYTPRYAVLPILMFEERIHFIKPNGVINKKTTFSSSYYCWNLLPKQIIMESLKKGEIL